MMAFACSADDVYGAIEDAPAMDCSICSNKTLITDLCGAMCRTCGFDIEAKRFQIVNFQRCRARFSIEQMADATGWASADIEAFENQHQPVSDEYFKAFCKVITAHYSKVSEGAGRV